MRETREVQSTYTVAIRCFCDKCGKKIVSEKFGDVYEDSWFEFKTGESYGADGGSGDLYKIDLCEECSLDLIKLMKENGYKVRGEEWDY
jgi:hypothetical protein